MVDELEELDNVKTASAAKTIAKAKKDGKLVIEEDDFTLIAVGDNGYAWDFYLLKTIRPKGKPERQELKLEGYGCVMSYIIKMVTMNRITTKFAGGSIDLNTFLEEFKANLERLNDLREKECLTRLKTW